MKIQLTILLILFGVNLLGQNREVDILTEKEALSILEHHGFDSLECYTQPINLVYLSEANSKTIIEKEFTTSFEKPHQDSLGVFVYNLPKYTIEIATVFKNEYAAQKLFEYYKSLPKHIKSDTIYDAYIRLDDLLSLLIFYNPKGLVETLEVDYYEWVILAQKAIPKKYKTLEEYRLEIVSVPFEESLKLKKGDLVVDCNYIAFQIAGALNKLGHTDFNTEFLSQLRQNQTIPFINNYRFPIFYNQNLGEHLYENIQQGIEIPPNYSTIGKLVTEPNKLEHILHQRIENCCDSRLIEILHNDKQNAYVEFSRNNGYDAYVIKLENNKLFTKEVWSIIE